MCMGITTRTNVVTTLLLLLILFGLAPVVSANTYSITNRVESSHQTGGIVSGAGADGTAGQDGADGRAGQDGAAGADGADGSDQPTDRTGRSSVRISNTVDGETIYEYDSSSSNADIVVAQTQQSTSSTASASASTTVQHDSSVSRITQILSLVSQMFSVYVNPFR